MLRFFASRGNPGQIKRRGWVCGVKWGKLVDICYINYFRRKERMESSLQHFNQYNTQSPFSWEGLQSNRFPKSRLMHPRRDIIKTGLDFPEQTFYSGRKHYDELRSSEGEFKPRLRQFRNIQHWHPRDSSKRVLDVHLTQPHPRREKGHFNQPVYEHFEKSAGIRTFYNTRLKDGVREYSLQDRMQRKVKLNQLEIRKGAFQNQGLSASLKFKA